MKLAEKYGYKLVVCSTLSQRPYLDYEDKARRHCYRINNETKSLSNLDITINKATINPIMAQQYKLHTDNSDLRKKYTETLEQPKMNHNGVQLFEACAEESTSIAFGRQVYKDIDQDFVVIVNIRSEKSF